MLRIQRRRDLARGRAVWRSWSGGYGVGSTRRGRIRWVTLPGATGSSPKRRTMHALRKLWNDQSGITAIE